MEMAMLARCEQGAVRQVEWLGELAFVSVWLFVGLVSAYDAYLVVLYAESILGMEQNPICRYLIERDTGLTLFLQAKGAGTCTVLAILGALYLRRQRQAQFIAGGVALFQLVLLWYLTMY
jgi:hypothetical protein